MKRLITLTMVIALAIQLRAQEWAGIAVPAQAGSGKEWQLQSNISDDFNYTMSEGNRPARFNDKWYPTYHNNWSGPGKTQWNSAQAWANGDQLAIQAVRVPGTDQVYCGIITNKTRIKYPVYFEISAKIMNQKLANAFWLLSPDDTQEIDAMEGYGGGAGQEWFAHRMHVSHHVFIRNPFQDYQPKDEGSWVYNSQPWRAEYHRYGCYWRDPWHLEYYIDGQLVRTVSGQNIIDPNGYTNGTGLNKEMDIIIDCENQTDWRPDPTDAELASENIFWVDWMRVYKPVNSSGGSSGATLTIEAENFNNTGGSYNDASAGGPGFGVNVSGSIINYVNGGDYVEYPISIPEEGAYTLTYRYATPINNTSVDFSVAGIPFFTTTLANTGGWGNYQDQTASQTAYFTAGNHTIRLTAGSADWQWNMDRFTLSKPGSARQGHDLFNDKEEVAPLSVYPVPASQSVNVKGLTQDQYHVDIYDVRGSLEMSSEISRSDAYTLPVNHLQQGMYILRVHTGGESYSLKLLVR
ncbi:carbohydrate-binding protein [Reichenbachiella agariperforans]|uniref:carbohydrate-binding protein n=1 Tax=Reichenbachiella agariperforans TaxID=156994 RepID=UPI001C092545|nr:carbohydrate-binding protein [Reichenbachiella agariperforans]MBU2912685.1 carbohydrate-binding protein [Reichenbachiella agariperforans]